MCRSKYCINHFSSIVREKCVHFSKLAYSVFVLHKRWVRLWSTTVCIDNTLTHARISLLRGHGKEIACSLPMRFARYFPRDVYFYRRWAACTSVVNASIWKFASDVDRKIKERLTYSPSLNVNERKSFVCRNFRMRIMLLK